MSKRSIYDFAYKPLKQNYTMLQVSDKDIENLKVEYDNLALDLLASLINFIISGNSTLTLLL